MRQDRVKRSRKPLIKLAFYIAYLLTLLATLPTPSYALPPEGEEILQALEGVREVKRTSVALLPEDLARLPDLAQIEHEIVPQAYELSHLLMNELREVQSQIPDREELLDHLSQDGIRKDFEGFGRGEVNTLNDIPFIRFVHNESKLSIAFMERGAIDPESKHFTQYIARQHLDAGEEVERGIWRGAKKGRDLVVVWTDKNEIVDIVYYPKTLPFITPGWWKTIWKDYWRSKIQLKIKRGDVILGTISGAAQSAITVTGFKVKDWVGGSEIPFELLSQEVMLPTLLTFAWGFGISALNPTYRNIVNSGPQWSEYLKLLANSMAFAYSLAVLRDGVAHVFDFTDFGTFLAAQLPLWINSLAHQEGRIGWRSWAKASSKFRMGPRYIRIRLGKWVYNTGLRVSSTVEQLIYLFPFTPKQWGLLGIGTLFTLGIPFVENGVPIDKATASLVLMAPVVRGSWVLWAKMRGYPKFDEIKKSIWDDWWAVRLTKGIGRLSVETPIRMASAVSRTCRAFLGALSVLKD